MKTLILSSITCLLLSACLEPDNDSNNQDDTDSITQSSTDTDTQTEANIDSDGDTVPDGDDFYPNNKLRWNDVDITDANYNAQCDCIINPLLDSDQDGYLDSQDAFPNDATEWLDLDQDGIGNNSDTDLDGDGTLNDEDLYPFNPLEAFDTDNDGIPNGQDIDDDNDLHLDINDHFPLDDSEYLDTDNDGIGNHTDPDIDGDGLNNAAHLLDDAEALSMGLDNDDDNDQTLNSQDQMPSNPNETLDYDSDGIGNNEDNDDDNDGYIDSQDAFATNENEWADFDNDQMGDNIDLDDDNDTFDDVVDPDPFDADVPSLRNNLCATPDIELIDINSMVDFINAMEKPLNLPCFIQALPRPFIMNATTGTLSVQPAISDRNPRVFIAYGDFILSVVTELDDTREGQILEVSELLSDTRSIKGELIFPIIETIDHGSPFDHIRNESGVGSLCGLCHANEVVFETREGIEVFESDALKPSPTTLVPVSDLREARNICNADDEPYRCDMLRSIFDHGTVKDYEFPELMLEFL